MVRALNTVRAKYGVPPSPHPFGDFTTSLGLANTFVGFEAATSLPPHIKMVGPIESSECPSLTRSLEVFLEDHPRTMYIGFGSVVVLAEFDLHNLVVGSLNALANGSIDGVIWGLGRTTIDDFPSTFSINGSVVTSDFLYNNRHPHIQILPWAPQAAILEHKNTKLFLSHSGLESSFEAINSGTPVLCMPFLGDQPRNARKLEDAGIGKYVDRVKATPSSISKDISSMLEDPHGEIAMNVARMQTLASGRARRKEEGADAVEEYAYTAIACRPSQTHKYGEIPCELKHLTMASRHMPYIKANLIDVYLFAIFLVLAFSLAGTKAVLKLARVIKRKLQPTVSEERKSQ
ncbi:hypothetical protein DSO57_1025761 [Entomophthora muscae]|uniref:Uncharacterized protein n=1 Tax=Entomophthora muscae TaxID=34485 RepID=A0ACC2S411_9FUNG|nr:hypothetical protein DSO57_1025761 [Entomophthora muscae]